LIDKWFTGWVAPLYDMKNKLNALFFCCFDGPVPNLQQMEKKFTRQLMRWHIEQNIREMPWKGEKDPYKIWLSEIILQQTRVAQGWQYYLRFIEKFPCIQDLAAAKDAEIFKLWEGLGYYTRCKNLIATARYIVNERGGVFPDRYDDILQLKGVGPYTAAAIASFAFNQPYAVVDGNVFRVLSRFFGIATAIDGTNGKKLFSELAGHTLDRQAPGVYNQAIMDFGAVVCKPAAPLCGACPLRKNCRAFAEGRVNQLPVKEKNLTRKHRWFYYFIFSCEGKYWVRKREAGDIWENLHEFYLVETESAVSWTESSVREMLFTQMRIRDVASVSISPMQKQQLTHQEIKGQMIRIHLHKAPSFLSQQGWKPLGAIRKLAFPRFINTYLEQYPLTADAGFVNKP
jgi:A/G-specific adenine glycosylase